MRMLQRIKQQVHAGVMRARGYSVCHVQGGVRFDGPQPWARLDRRVIVHLYAGHMRRRGFTLVRTKGGPSFEGRLSSPGNGPTRLERFIDACFERWFATVRS